MKRLVIIGATGHGKVAADIANKNGYIDIVFLDNDKLKKTCGGYPVVGRMDDAIKYSDSKFIIAIGDNLIRQKSIRI